MNLTATETEAKAFCIAVQDAVGVHKNPDFPGAYRHDRSSEDAARNLVAGKPAFGWLTSYHNAPAGTFAETVNLLGGIEAAQDDLARYFANNGRDVTDEQWLDNLLPLNKAAAMDLMRAYQRVGTFRTASELADRTKRYLPAQEQPAVFTAVADALGVPAVAAE